MKAGKHVVPHQYTTVYILNYILDRASVHHDTPHCLTLTFHPLRSAIDLDSCWPSAVDRERTGTYARRLVVNHST